MFHQHGKVKKTWCCRKVNHLFGETTSSGRTNASGSPGKSKCQQVLWEHADAIFGQTPNRYTLLKVVAVLVTVRHVGIGFTSKPKNTLPGTPGAHALRVDQVWQGSTHFELQCFRQIIKVPVLRGDGLYQRHNHHRRELRRTRPQRLPQASQTLDRNLLQEPGKCIPRLLPCQASKPT